MKKILLMVCSWAMLLMGAISFNSCGDDDDENEQVTNGGSNSSSAASIMAKYKDFKGVKVDGDVVVYSDPTFLGFPYVSIFEFNGDKVARNISYIDYKNETLAKAAYDEAKNEGGVKNPKIDGTILSFEEELDEEILGMSKSDIVNYYSEDF